MLVLRTHKYYCIPSVGRSSLLNPYHHWAGAWVGDWDISVLVEALKRRGMFVQQHIIYDSRNPHRLDEDLVALRDRVETITSRTVGLIVNETSRNRWIPFLQSKHWYSLTPVSRGISGRDSVWCVRDSLLSAPVTLRDGDCGAAALVSFLRGRATSASAQLFLVSMDQHFSESTDAKPESDGSGCL